MTGYECVKETIEIFENKLANEVSHDNPFSITTVNEFARRSGYSIFHFSRLFSSITGVSPKEYITGRILSEAALKIADTNISISDIAYNLGFLNYQTFSRSFKQMFSITPKEVRKKRNLPSEIKDRITLKENTASFDLQSKDPIILERDSFIITGLPFYIESKEFSLHSQWRKFFKLKDQIVGVVNPSQFYQFSSWDEHNEILSILCGTEVHSGKKQPMIFYSQSIPDSMYLKFTHVGEISNIHKTYQYIYEDWFSTHDAIPKYDWEFQQYSQDCSETEIWIPFEDVK